MGRRVFYKHVDPMQIQAHIQAADLATEIKLGETITHECAVIFFDLVNFTNISWSLSGEDVMGILQPFFQKVALEIERQNGLVDKFPGDGVVGFFPRYYQNEHNIMVDGAVDCATKVMYWFYNTLRPSVSLPKPSHMLELCVGIDAGQVSIAHVGSNSHSELVLLGDQVNCASKCQAAADKKEVVVGQDAIRTLHYEGFYGSYMTTGPSTGVVYTDDNRPYRSFRFDWQRYAQDYEWAR